MKSIGTNRVPWANALEAVSDDTVDFVIAVTDLKLPPARHWIRISLKFIANWRDVRRAARPLVHVAYTMQRGSRRPSRI